MNRVKRYYTIMFVSDDNTKPFSIRLHKNIVHTFVLFIGTLTLAVFLFVLYFGQISLKLQSVNSLRKEVSKLTEEKTRLVAGLQKSNRLEELAEYLEKIATQTKENKIAPPPNTDVVLEDFTTALVQETKPEQSQTPSNIQREKPETEKYWAHVPNIRPIDGWSTKMFSNNDKLGDHTHLGIDIAASTGTPIRATAPGIVSDVTYDQYLGNLVTIKHLFGFTTRYAHCSLVLVKEGDDIKRGQTIALCGSTGRSTAAHVHYEVLKDGKNIDPMIYILN